MEETKDNEYAISGVTQKISRHSLLLETKTNEIKSNLLKAIKEDNLEEAQRLYQVEQITPNEELSKFGYFWNALHYCGHYGRSRILEWMIEQVYKQYGQEDTKAILNQQTKEGWTCLMLSCIYESVLCVKVLLKLGGVKLNTKDAMGRNAFDLCKSYGQVDCFELIHEANEIYGDEIPLNMAYLDDKVDELFDQLSVAPKEYHFLCLSGIPRDCVICRTNKGYMKYTQCCSTPVHLVCFVEQVNKDCVICGKQNYNITRELREPEKAFFAENSQEHRDQEQGRLEEKQEAQILRQTEGQQQQQQQQEQEIKPLEELVAAENVENQGKEVKEIDHINPQQNIDNKDNTQQLDPLDIQEHLQAQSEQFQKEDQ